MRGYVEEGKGEGKEGQERKGMLGRGEVKDKKGELLRITLPRGS